MERIRPDQLPEEFEIRRNGYVMRGWDFSREELAAAINEGRMLNPTFEGMGNYCMHNCNYCFTERDNSPDGHKRRLATELPIRDRLRIIREAAALGARTMNFVGAGEPTADKHFWKLVECVADLKMVPIVFTEASRRLTDRKFVERLYGLDATVVIKMNSLWNREYQNRVVAGDTGSVSSNYFGRRNMALEICRQVGFASHTPTRLGFDTIVTRQNRDEMPHLHRYARDNNIFLEAKGFLRTGRARESRVDDLTVTEMNEVWQELCVIDAQEYGIKRRSGFPFGGGVPCNLRSVGFHISIEGKVFRCDGQETPIGDLRLESLAEVWHRVRHIDQNIRGGCPPRERFWKIHPSTIKSPHRLPILR